MSGARPALTTPPRRKQRRSTKDASIISSPTTVSYTSSSSSSSFHTSDPHPLSPFVLPVLLAFYALLLTALTLLTSRVVPLPYMDEPFHHGQALAYCRGDFSSWDPKITTLPGLYAATVAVHSALSWATPLSCSLSFVRAYNVAWAVGSLGLFWGLLGRMGGDGLGMGRRVLVALQFALFPVHLFYVPLYYTDAFSTFTVLLVAHCAMGQAGVARRPSSALVSSPLPQFAAAAVSVLARQTNVLWVAFIAGYVLVRRALASSSTGSAHTSPGSLAAGVEQLLRWVAANCPLVVQMLWPYAVVGAAFAAFLVWNGGSVVVGDRSNHATTVHLGQLLHFAAFTAAFLSCRLVVDGSLAPSLGRWSVSAVGVAVGTAAAVAAVLRWATFAHPFLLADNRHVTFHVWRYIFGRHALVRYALTPLYVGSLYAVQRLLRHQPLLVQLGLAACVAVALVPSPLLEFRYFIVPFTLVLLLSEAGRGESGQGKWRMWGDVAQIAVYIVVDVVMGYVFLFRPYTWGDGSTARYMW